MHNLKQLFKNILHSINISHAGDLYLDINEDIACRRVVFIKWYRSYSTYR